MPKTITAPQAALELDGYFQKIHQKSAGMPLQIRVVSEKTGLDYAYPSHSTNQPYHLASIGKMFTAALVQMLAERGAFAIKDPILPFFRPAELDNLFVYGGVDYAQQVTIEQLLGHTSGVADYFEGRTTNGKNFVKDVLTNSQRRWTPQELINFSRENQRAVGRPGQRYLYSDTGYILLGRLIENITGKSFAQNLEDEFFRPLEMRDSYLMFHAEPIHTPKKDIEKIWFGKQEVSGYTSLSCDWAGGGVVSTTEDLLKFNRALHHGRLVQDSTLTGMKICRNKFRSGIYYGLGMMEIRFSDFFFLLRGLPRVYGHIGVLATHLFHDPINEAHIIMNFGSTSRMVNSFYALIQIEQTLQRIR